MRVKRLEVVLILLLACVAPASAQEEPDNTAEPAAAESTLGAGEPAAASQASTEQAVETIPVAGTEPPPAGAADAVTLDTIEVTAQRRRQRLVDVPVAVTAMTQDQVEARGIQRLDDLNSLAPGLQVSRSPANTTISQLTIRGSSQINPAIYWDPAVGVYLDGVYIGKAQGSIFDIVDISGVEVLRGPQGTLYGRNTIAGTINFITREPSGNFSGNAAIEYGNLNARVLRASMDLPRLAIADITIAVRSERRDPWIVTTPASPVDGMNNRHNDGAHFATVLDIAQGLEALYRLDYSETDQTNNFLQLYRSDDARLQPYISKTRRATADIRAPSGELARVEGHSLTFNWDVNETSVVKAISGFRRVKWVDKLDLDGSPEVVAQSQRHTDYEQLSQDLQYSGRTALWNYTAGVYYFEDDGFTNNPIYLLDGLLDFDSRYGAQSEAWAGYGQADWQPLEPLTLTAGVRYTREKKGLDRVFGHRQSTAQPYTYYMPEGYKTPGTTFTATTPMFSAAWRFNEQLNVYARYAEGFKSGGYNGEYSSLTDTPEANQQETNTPFRPEKQKSIELGAKTSFLGGKALLNAAAFQNKLVDLQASIFTAQGAAASVIRNAGKATVKGIEIEGAMILFEGTQLRANYAWLDPHYDEFIDAGQNVADNRAFVHAPETSYNLVLDSELLTTGWGTLRLVADYVWTDSFYTYPYQLKPDPNPPGQQKQEAENTRVAAYGLLNTRLALAAIPLGGTRLGEISLWGRNLLDDATPNNYIDFGPTFQNLTIANFVEPRTFGISGLLRW
jgi:iron complex outermembrane receptor protein